MVLQCSNCKKSTFNSQQGLAAHRARCKIGKDELLSRDHNTAAAALAKAFKKKKARKKGPQDYPSLRPNQNIDLDAGASLSAVIHPPPVPDPEPEGSRSRSGRLRIFPSRYKDFLPAQTIPLAHAPQPSPRHRSELPCDDPAPSDHATEPESTVLTTSVNDAGLFRVYPIKPTSDPDSIIGLEDVCKSHLFAVNSSHSDHDPLLANGILPQSQDQAFYAPYSSPSVYRLITWFLSGSQTTSLANLNSLVADVISAPDFNALDFVGFSAAKEVKRLDDYPDSLAVSSDAVNFSPSHGWTESSVPLALPCERQNLKNESNAPRFDVSGLFHQDVVDVVTTAFQDPEIFLTLHLTPYKEYRILGEGHSPERVYGEMYTSDAFLDAWDSVQSQTDAVGDCLERIMVALMLWSDSTHLTNFGSASLWPAYLSLGNQSKYI